RSLRGGTDRVALEPRLMNASLASDGFKRNRIFGSHSGCGLILFPLALAQAHSGTTTVLVDELHTARRQSVPNGLNCESGYPASFFFEIHDCRQSQIGCVRKLALQPVDLSGNLIVQLGLATEDLDRRWYQANTGHVLSDIQRRIRHPVLRWMAA